MSMRTHITKLNKKMQNKIKNCLLHNGLTQDDISILWTNLTLADISDYMDIEEVLNEY